MSLGQLTSISRRRVSELIGVNSLLNTDLSIVLWRSSESRHELQLDLEFVRVWITAIYWLKDSSWVVSPISHEHLSSVVGRVILMKCILNIVRRTAYKQNEKLTSRSITAWRPSYVKRPF